MKKGITFSVLAVAVSIMIITVTTAVVFGTRAADSASYEEYISKLKRMEDGINYYQEKNDDLPTVGVLAKTDISDEFLQALTSNGDQDSDLYIVDMSKLNVVNVDIGYGLPTTDDIFLLASGTNNLYYLAGMEYKGRVRFNIER